MRREELYSLLLEKITSGKLPAGAKVTENELSRECGISRTPLRQVLFELVSNRFLNYEKNKGFSIPPLLRQEVDECYTLIRILEREALVSGFEVLRSQIETLRALNKRFGRARTSSECRIYDEQFHDKIVAASSNQTLAELLQLLKLRAKRYDLLFFLEKEYVVHSFSQHEDLIAALEKNDPEAAETALCANWSFGQKHFLRTL